MGRKGRQEAGSGEAGPVGISASGLSAPPECPQHPESLGRVQGPRGAQARATLISD